MYPDAQLKNISLPNGKTLFDVHLRRARIQAMVLASATIISLAFLTFAFTQKQRADDLEVKLSSAIADLEACRTGSY